MKKPENKAKKKTLATASCDARSVDMFNLIKKTKAEKNRTKIKMYNKDDLFILFLFRKSKEEFG